MTVLDVLDLAMGAVLVSASVALGYWLGREHRDDVDA